MILDFGGSEMAKEEQGRGYAVNNDPKKKTVNVNRIFSSIVIVENKLYFRIQALASNYIHFYDTYVHKNVKSAEEIYCNTRLQNNSE